MNNYIQIYKNVIQPEYCDELIQRFENSSKQWEIHDQGPMSFSQINLNMNDEWKPDVQILTNTYMKRVKVRTTDTNLPKASCASKAI